MKMVYPHSRLDEFKVTTRMVDIAGASALALGVATAVYRVKKHHAALAQVRKLESSMKERVDVRKEIKKHADKTKGLPLTVITDQKEFETKVKPTIRTLGFDVDETRSLLKSGRDIMKDVFVGHNAYVWTLHGPKKKAVFLITPPKLARISFMHELGHLQSMKAGTSLSRLDMRDIERTFFTALDTLSGIYSRYGRYGSYKEEQRAWDIAGVPSGHPLRKAALASYKHGTKLNQLLFKMIALAGAYPMLRGILMHKGGSVNVTTPKFMKEDVGLLRMGIPRGGIPGQMVEFL